MDSQVLHKKIFWKKIVQAVAQKNFMQKKSVQAVAQKKSWQ
jgi:hypothetical protein